MNTVIKAEGLSKKYIIKQNKQESYLALRDVLTEGLKNIFTKKSKSSINDFWALKDINFEINQGERIGIIGRNGAGKSTLLKVLSRITDPTSGKVFLKGKVSSLLEVGTGFHPELTGRENIYLNGAILGMTRYEIKKKFDEIISFAEIEKFLDTPVKRYSSGMYVRLAFSVAAHLEPDIMIVDEVLAVGDAHFQKKCLGKMEDVSNKDGKTILFVSHNMGIIKQLCDKAIVIDKGKILFRGNTSEAINKYLSMGVNQNSYEVDLENNPNRLGNMKTILKKAYLCSTDGLNTNNFSQSDNIILSIEYNGTDIVTSLSGIGFIIYTGEGVKVGSGNTYMYNPPPYKIPLKGKIKFEICSKQLTPGNYFITLSVGSHQGSLEDKVESAIYFTINQSDIYGTGYLLTKEDGVITLKFKAGIFDVK